MFTSTQKTRCSSPDPRLLWCVHCCHKHLAIRTGCLTGMMYWLCLHRTFNTVQKTWSQTFTASRSSMKQSVTAECHLLTSLGILVSWLPILSVVQCSATCSVTNLEPWTTLQTNHEIGRWHWWTDLQVGRHRSYHASCWVVRERTVVPVKAGNTTSLIWNAATSNQNDYHWMRSVTPNTSVIKKNDYASSFWCWWTRKWKEWFCDSEAFTPWLEMIIFTDVVPSQYPWRAGL